MNAVNPASAVSSHVMLNDGKITISHDGQQENIDVRDIDRVIVLGGGKATARMAVALESILGDLVKEGLIIIPRALLEREPFNSMRIRAAGAGHPIPDQAGVDAVTGMIEIARRCTERDLVFCLISGGGSALMPQPASNITLDDLQAMNRVLLESGASIHEVNTVRKHVSKIKGGWLATYLARARVFGLVLSDVVGDDLSTIASGLTVPDPTSFADAMLVLERRGIKAKVPGRVVDYLARGLERLVPETPKPGDSAFKNVTSVIIGSAAVAATRVQEAAVEKPGCASAFVLSNDVQGEARQVGHLVHDMVGAILARKETIDVPAARPGSGSTRAVVCYKPAGRYGSTNSVLVLTGETTVTLRGTGVGGRNQELLLGFIEHVNHHEGRFAIISCGMDGIEGNSPAAGAIVDDQTYNRALDKGLDIEQFLSRNDSHAFFESLNDTIYTGLTGTNVNDITIILLDAPIENIVME